MDNRISILVVIASSKPAFYRGVALVDTYVRKLVIWGLEAEDTVNWLPGRVECFESTLPLGSAPTPSSGQCVNRIKTARIRQQIKIDGFARFEGFQDTDDLLLCISPVCKIRVQVEENHDDRLDVRAYAAKGNDLLSLPRIGVNPTFRPQYTNDPDRQREVVVPGYELLRRLQMVDETGLDGIYAWVRTQPSVSLGMTYQDVVQEGFKAMIEAAGLKLEERTVPRKQSSSITWKECRPRTERSL